MTPGAIEDKVNEANELVGRDGIEPPTPGFSVLVPTGDYRALFDRIGRNLGVSLPATQNQQVALNRLHRYVRRTA
jgi:hypothetical protein